MNNEAHGLNLVTWPGGYFRAAVCAGWMLAVVAAAEAGYLTKVGPSRIRSQAPPPPAASPALLALALPAPTTNTVAATNSPLPVAVTIAAVPETIVVKSPPPPAPEPVGEPELSPFWEPPASPGASPVITPQMLVPFFFQKNAEAAGQETGVVVPLSFTPPRPGQPATSKARLQVE